MIPAHWIASLTLLNQNLACSFESRSLHMRKSKWQLSAISHSLRAIQLSLPARDEWGEREENPQI